MDLDARKWYVRWFFWSNGIWDAFNDRDNKWQIEQRGTNLCYFMRVTLIWAPLVLLLHAIVYGAAIGALTYFPFVFFGGSRYSWGVGAIVVLALVIFAIKITNRYLRERDLDRQLTRARMRVAPEEPATPGFWEVVWAWLVALKKKVCPTITFIKQEVQG